MASEECKLYYGEDVADLLDTTRQQEEKYNQISKFDKYLQVQKNIVYEWASFNRANQLCDESAEQFITRLHQMAESCKFGNLSREMIQDRLFTGIWDAQLLSPKLRNLFVSGMQLQNSSVLWSNPTKGQLDQCWGMPPWNNDTCWVKSSQKHGIHLLLDVDFLYQNANVGKAHTQSNNVPAMMLLVIDVSVLDITSPSASLRQWLKLQLHCSHLRLQITDDIYSDPVYQNTVTEQ